jgi:hypothetical protein
MKGDRNLPNVPVTRKSGASAPREAFRNQRELHGEVCPCHWSLSFLRLKKNLPTDLTDLLYQVEC